MNRIQKNLFCSAYILLSLAFGVSFSSCSGGGSGSGSGGGSASGLAPDISVNAFPGTTAAELTITDQSHPDGLEVSGQCSSSEHGQTVTVTAQGDETVTIEKQAPCDNPPDGSAANDDPHWSVTLDRADLDKLQGKNMKALFTASVQSKKGVTGTSQPQALFVEPIIESAQGGGASQSVVVLEDIYLINGVCRHVLLVNVPDNGPLLLAKRRASDGQSFAQVQIFRNDGGVLDISTRDFLSGEEWTAFPDNTQGNHPFIAKFTATIPQNGTEAYYHTSGAFRTKAYSYCKGVPGQP